MKNKRSLRLKVTMSFGGGLVLPAGVYTGENIPGELEREFELGSAHVEEVNVRKAVVVEDDADPIGQKKVSTKAKHKASVEPADNTGPDSLKELEAKKAIDAIVAQKEETKSK